MTYSTQFANRAEKDFARLDRDTQSRIRDRVRELAADPYDLRLSQVLTGRGGLRKSRVGGWRIIFTLDDKAKVLSVVTIERRGQVYKRI